MFKRLIQVFLWVLSEASAWMGLRERLHLRLIADVETMNLKEFLRQQILEMKIEPMSLVEDLFQAIDNERLLRVLFIEDTKKMDGTTYVLTMDLSVQRVDRDLSSQCLLNDCWHAELTDKDSVARSWYRNAFLAQKEFRSVSRGYSRRFHSLAVCLEKDMGDDAHVLQRMLHNLWNHERWLNQHVSIGEAVHALIEATLEVTWFDYDRETPSEHALGSVVQHGVWIDSTGNRIGELFAYADDDAASVVDCHVNVFGSKFHGREAEQLSVTFHTRVVKDQKKRKIVQDFASPS